MFLIKILLFLTETSLLASVLTLTVISVGRFVAVMFPIHSHTSPNHDHRVIAAVWVISALISCPTLFYRELYSTEVGMLVRVEQILTQVQIPYRDTDWMKTLIVKLW